MQLTAKLTQLLPIQTGTGKTGEWKKQDITVETDGQYPNKVCISIWGDKINVSQLQVIERREHNGRWYTDIKAWKVVANESNGIYQSPLNYNSSDNNSSDDDDILPF